MGEEKQRVSMRWGRETVEQADFLLSEFGGLIEDQSHLSRIAIRWAYVRVNTIGIVRAVEEFLQGKHCTTSLTDADADRQSKTEFPATAPIEGRAKPLTRITASKDSGARRREVNGVSRRMAVLEEDKALYFPLFLGKVRPFKSTPYQEVA